MTAAHARRAAYRRGLFAERVCAAMLRAKGYRVVARRYRTPVGEIDLVARRGATIVFVEVKQRSGGDDDVIAPRQQARIRRAAEAWLAREAVQNRLPADYAARFDVMLVARWRLPRHLPGAFATGL